MYRPWFSKHHGNIHRHRVHKSFNMFQKRAIIFLTFVLLVYYVLELCASEDINTNKNDDKDNNTEEGESSIIPGVEIDIIKKPKYCMNRAKKGDLVFFHVDSKILETNAVFESSRKGKPFSVQLGKHHVSEVIESMLENLCVGDRRIYVGNLSTIYGNKTFSNPDGTPIDQSSTIMMDIEVKDIQESPDPLELFDMLSKGEEKISVEKLKTVMSKTMQNPDFPMEIQSGNLEGLLDYALKLSDKDADGFLTNEEFMNSVLLDNDPEGHTLIEQYTINMQEKEEKNATETAKENAKTDENTSDEPVKKDKDEL